MTIRGVGLANLANGRWKDQSSADEMATMFLEAAPHLCARDDPPVDVRDPPRVPPARDPLEGSLGVRSSASAPGAGRLRARLRACVPAPVDDVDWSALRAVVPSEAASDVDADDARVSVVDVNSGGAVFFCVFAPDSAPGSAPGSAPARERILVVKFCANRLAAQSEYFAHEIARAVGVVVPDARLLRKTAAPLPGAPVDSAPTPEHSAPSTAPSSAPSSWAAASRAAKSLSEAYEAASEEIRADASPEDEDPFDFASAAASFASHLDKHQAALALRFVRGEPLFDREGVPLASAFADPIVAGDVAESLGRVFVLDALLANPDRLQCRALGWRGNPGNLLFGVAGTGTGAGERIRTVVAIDQAVPRRPPAHRARADAAAMPGAIETARNHPPSAAATLREALGGADAIEAAGVCAEDVDGALARRFSEGVREAVEKAAKLKGLFDSLATGLYETLRMLFDDMEDMRREAEREAKAAKASKAAEAAKTKAAEAAEAAKTKAAKTAEKERSGSPEPSERSRTPSERSPAKALLDARRERRASAAAAVSASVPIVGRSPSPDRVVSVVVPQKALRFPGDGGGAMVPTTPVDGSSRPAPLVHDRSAEHHPEHLPEHHPEHPNTPPLDEPRGRPENNALGAGDAPGGIGTPARGAVSAAAPIAPQGTMRLRKVQKDAKGDEGVSEWLVDWEDVMRDDKATLKTRCGEWARRRGLDGGMHTGFLDVSTGRDIVDCYELWVRLQHLSRRGADIVAAGNTLAPSLVAPRIFLGGALAANARHTLEALGVTHVLNCTDDVADAHPDAFTFARVSAKDIKEEDLSAHFDDASAFISEALASDPDAAVLVHCFEGKSRSATVVAQHVVRTTRRSLRETLDEMTRAHPDTKPNEGFVKLLARFEKETLGSQSVVVKKSTRPTMRRCPKCGVACGLSAQSVTVHIKKAHPGMGL